MKELEQLKKWLFKKYEDYAKRMATTNDENGVNMHSFYHGSLSFCKDVLDQVMYIIAKKESEEK